MDNNQDNYICNICNKSYSNYESLWKHKNMITNINNILENLNDKTEKKDNCIYCNKIYNSQHVRFCLYDNFVIDNIKTIFEHEQECKIIFEHAQECKILLEGEDEIILLENELTKKCSFSGNKKKLKL